MMHKPAEWRATEVPATVQTEVSSEEKMTVRPDEAVAEILNGVWSRRRPDSAPNVIV